MVEMMYRIVEQWSLGTGGLCAEVLQCTGYVVLYTVTGDIWSLCRGDHQYKLNSIL